MDMNWIDDTTCPLCGKEDCKNRFARTIPYPAKRGAKKTNEPKLLQLIYHECPDCGFRFMSPRPDAGSQLRRYTDMTYRDGCTMTQRQMDAGETARAYRIQKYIPKDASSHLDMGCSRGYLVGLSKDLGRKVLGVEPNRGYVTEAVPVISPAGTINYQFDVVTCIHVLEHVPDPKGMAERLIAHTKPGGTLIVEVPSETTPGESSGLQHPWAFQLHTMK